MTNRPQDQYSETFLKALKCTHFDGKFGVTRIANDDHNLAPDEPVFVFRGSDKHMPAVLMLYSDLCATGDSPPDHIEGIHEAIRQVMSWQQDNPGKVKTPD